MESLSIEWNGVTCFFDPFLIPDCPDETTALSLVLNAIDFPFDESLTESWYFTLEVR